MSSSDWTKDKGTLPAHLEGATIPWGPLGEDIYNRTYPLTKNGREVREARRRQRTEPSVIVPKEQKENWPETVVRVVDGNLSLVSPEFIEPDERGKLIDLLFHFGIIPAGRHLSASGVQGRQFLFNCHAAGWDPQAPGDHFTFLFDQLMQGGGVGSNYSNRYLEKLPVITRQIDLHIACREDHANYNEFSHLICKHDGCDKDERYVVTDDREGWVEAVARIFRLAYSSNELTPNPAPITIDVSNIRDRGDVLVTSGGTACGPGPLVLMLNDLVKALNTCYARKLTSQDAMSLDHILAACVIAGGKRRSSRMSVKNWRDHDIFDFINCKREDGAHWSTNISVEVDDEFFNAYRGDVKRIVSEVEPFTATSKVCEKCQTLIRADSTDCVVCLGKRARDVMRTVVLGKRLNGEPGFWNRSLAMKGEGDPEAMFCPNPCGEIGLQMWENCNLGHVNLGYFVKRGKAQMMEAFRLMTRWLIRATFGDIPSSRQKEVTYRNRRIGVGFIGYHEWLALNGIKYSESWKNDMVRSRLQEASMSVQHEAYRYSQMLGIPCPVKNTALAPTGTTAMMPGTTASGQAMIAAWFRRLVRYSDMDPIVEVKRKEGYEVFPDDDAPNTSIVVNWCEDPLASKVKAAGWSLDILESQYDISLENSLNVQAMFQELYADNAVSFTINLTPEKLVSEEDMEAQLFAALPRLKGTTIYVEKSRKNSPIQPITKELFDFYEGPKQVQQIEDECKNGCPVK